MISQLQLLSGLRRHTIKADGGVYLTHPNIDHFDQWLDLRTRSRAFLEPWEPKWPSDDLSLVGFRRRLRSYQQQRNSGWGRTYFLMDEASDELLGGLSLTRIVHGISKSATLGYWMGVDHAGKGHMQNAVSAIIQFSFNDLKLRRVEAACLPSNERSIHLLQKSGFQREGYAREYLEINGKREDHILFALLKSETRF